MVVPWRTINLDENVNQWKNLYSEKKGSLGF